LNDRLFAALERNGIQYARRTSDRGVPYAGFRWVDPPTSSDLSITAILEQDALRVTVHNLRFPADPAAVSRTARVLPLGSVYVSPESGQVEMSLPAYVGSAADLSILLMEFLTYAVDACRYLEGRGGRPDVPHVSSAAAEGGRDVASALAELGHHPTLLENGAAIEIGSGGSVVVAAEVRERPDGWFAADGRYVPAAVRIWGDDEYALLQRLQRWTVAGRFLLQDSGELRADVLTPNLGQPPNELLSWTIDQLTVMLQTAAKHLHIAE
jgi:hypothetical protein